MSVNGIDGLDALQARFGKMLRDIPHASDAAVSDVAHDLLGRSTAIVPHDKGDLEGAAAVRPIGRAQYEVGYWGIVYAWVQHEDLTYRHAPGRQAKYLESPFAANIRRYIQYIADQTRKGL